jgi:hypothetical protein
MLGAWLGAHLGIGKIPRTWIARLNHGGRISAAIDKIVLPARKEIVASGWG